MNRTQLNRINSDVEVLKDYSTASVKEIARKQKQLVRTREAKTNNTNINDINVYKKVLQELCENGVEVYVRERIEELCSKNKLSVEEVTYLFKNDYSNF